MHRFSRSLPHGFAWVCALLPALLFLSGRESLAQSNEQEPKSSPAAAAQYTDSANIQNNGEYDLAATQWKAFLKKYPNDPLAANARHYLGVCLLQLKQYSEAAAVFREVIDKHANFDFLDETHVNLGWCQYSLALAGDDSKYADASTTFLAFVEEFPKSKLLDQALFYLGECLYLQNKRAEAIPVYQRLVDDLPDSRLRPDAMYALGVAQQETNQHEHAAKTFDAFLSEFADSELVTEIRMRRAETVVQSKDYARAAKMFAEVAAVKGFESADHAVFRQAFCLAMLEEFGEAGELYARIPTEYAKSPHTNEAIMAAGRAFYRAEQYGDAARWFQECVKKELPTATEAAHWLCRIALRQGQPAVAQEIAETALPKAADNAYLANLKLDYADALYETPNQREKALSAYVKIAAQHQDSPVAPQALYNAAYAAMEMKRFEEAIRYGGQFVADHAENGLLPDSRYVIAESHLLAGQADVAAKLYLELLTDHKSHQQAAIWRLRYATALQVQNQPEATIEVLQPLLDGQQTPDVAAETHFLIGTSQARSEQHANAIESFENSLRLSSTWRKADETLLSLARAQAKIRQSEAAAKSLERFLSDFASSSHIDRAHFQLAEVQYQAGDMKAAGHYYEILLEKWPKSSLRPHALYGLAWAQFKAGDAKTASDTLTQLIQDFDKHALTARAYRTRAMCRQTAGDFQGGQDDVAAFLRSKPSENDELDALYIRGLCEVGLKQYDAAVVTFVSILDKAAKYPRTDQVLYELAWALRSTERHDEGTKRFAELAERFPESSLAPEANYHVGEKCYSAKNYAAAAEEYTAALRKAGDQPLGEKAAYKLGWSNYQLSRFEPALAAFGLQLEKFGDGPLKSDGQFMKGECLFKLKKFNEALDAFRNLENGESLSENARVLRLLHAGQSAGQLKQWEESVKWLSQIAESHPQAPQLPQAQYELAWAYQNLNQMDLAEKLYESVIESSRDETGARARFMLGELHFAKKDFAGALNQFQLLMYGFGGDQAPSEIQRWQAKGGLEAARCAAIQAGQTNDTQRRKQLVDRAAKYYQRVAQFYPGTQEAEAAASQLKKLGSP